MSTIAPIPDPERNPRVKAVFDDIRATRKTDFINNLWQRLAFDPALLEATWAEVKQVMATPSAIWCETGGKPKGPGTFTDRAVIEDGYVYAPEAVGFGMQVRDEVLERYGAKP